MDYNALRDEAVRDRVRQAQEFLDPRTLKLEALCDRSIGTKLTGNLTYR